MVQLRSVLHSSAYSCLNFNYRFQSAVKIKVMCPISTAYYSLMCSSLNEVFIVVMC